MPVPKKRTTLTSETTKVESSDHTMPDAQEFRQRLRNLAVSAVRVVIEEVMREELEQCLGAAWGEVTPERKGYRNGTYTRKAARGSKLLDQLDHLKSLAIMTQVVHILVGTYDLMVFRNLSAQLSRRSVDVHFSRYRATSESDVRAFKSVLWSFQRNLPLEEEPDLIHSWKYCYERTIGCVGILKDWLTRALAEALEHDEKTLSRTLLEQHALSVDRCGQMVTEVIAGETALTEDDHAAYRLRIRFGLEQGSVEQHEQSQGNIPSQRRQSRVGQRKPARDSVKKES